MVQHLASPFEMGDSFNNFHENNKIDCSWIPSQQSRTQIPDFVQILICQVKYSKVNFILTFNILDCVSFLWREIVLSSVPPIPL